MDNRSILSELLAATEKNEHSRFELLRNFKDYLAARYVRYSLILLVSDLDRNAEKLFNKYCRLQAKGTDDVSMLLAYNCLNKILVFYKEELRIAEELVNEFNSYMFSGNFISMITGKTRPIEDLHDYRKVK